MACKKVIVLCLAALPGAVLGHHSRFEYDDGELAEVQGRVQSVFWRNPHIGITLQVANEQGEQEEWQLEGGTYNDLMRTGFQTDSLAIGDRIRALGGPSRRGAAKAIGSGRRRRSALP